MVGSISSTVNALRMMDYYSNKTNTDFAVKTARQAEEMPGKIMKIAAVERVTALQEENVGKAIDIIV